MEQYKITEADIKKEEESKQNITISNNSLLKEIKSLEESLSLTTKQNMELNQQITLIYQLNNFEREARNALDNL